MDRITKSLLESFVQENELDNLPEYMQFEHFTNFSIVSKLTRSSFDLDDIHTGKNSDCAIDGCCIFANGRFMIEIEELNDIVEGSGFLDCDLTFIQAKTSSSFDGSEIGNFIHGVKDFLSDESDSAKMIN